MPPSKTMIAAAPLPKFIKDFNSFISFLISSKSLKIVFIRSAHTFSWYEILKPFVSSKCSLRVIVFVPLGGSGPIDILTLNTKTGKIKTYDVKTQNFRSNGHKIYRGRTDEQRKLGVKILNFDPKK